MKRTNFIALISLTLPLSYSCKLDKKEKQNHNDDTIIITQTKQLPTYTIEEVEKDFSFQENSIEKSAKAVLSASAEYESLKEYTQAVENILKKYGQGYRIEGEVGSPDHFLKNKDILVADLSVAKEDLKRLRLEIFPMKGHWIMQGQHAPQFIQVAHVKEAKDGKKILIVDTRAEKELELNHIENGVFETEIDGSQVKVNFETDETLKLKADNSSKELSLRKLTNDEYKKIVESEEDLRRELQGGWEISRYYLRYIELDEKGEKKNLISELDQDEIPTETSIVTKDGREVFNLLRLYFSTHQLSVSYKTILEPSIIINMNKGPMLDSTFRISTADQVINNGSPLIEIYKEKEVLKRNEKAIDEGRSSIEPGHIYSVKIEESSGTKKEKVLILRSDEVVTLDDGRKALKIEIIDYKRTKK